MNTYIMDALKRLKSSFYSDELVFSDSIDSIIGEIEMMKMEIEQHIANMLPTEEDKNIRDAAKNAVQKLSEILDLLEERPYDKNLINEISILIDEINY